MKQSFQDVASLWKADKRRWVKPSSYATYVMLIRKHLLPFFSGCADITAAMVQEYVDESLAAGLSVKTVSDSLVVLKMIMRYGEGLGAWPHCEYKVHYPSFAQKRQALQVLSGPDQKKLLLYLQENMSFRNLGLIICMNSGLRIGEVCGLQWKDLDVASGVIHITKTVQRIYLSDDGLAEYGIHVGRPKTASSIRDIPISSGLMKLVRPLRKLMPGEYFVVSNAPRPMEPRYLRDYFDRVLRHLGIQRVRFHALRHTFASRCIESKCDYKTVSVILGHSSLATTMDLYVHPCLADKRRCIEKMTKGLGVG